MREGDAWNEKRQKSIHLVTTRLEELLTELDAEIEHLQALKIGLLSGAIPHLQFTRPTTSVRPETRVRMSTAQEKREAKIRKKSQSEL